MLLPTSITISHF